MKAHIQYYLIPTGGNPVSDFLDSLTKKQQTKVLRILTYIQEYGLQAVIPHVKKLSGLPLWEIRILGKDNIRVFYVLVQEDIVLVLHGFIKKKQKTPLKEIGLALTRYREWLDRKTH